MSTELALDESTAFITGASSGIGRTTAKVLARDGANVTIVARREERLRTVAKNIRDKYGVEVLVAPADVSKNSEVTAAVEMAIDTFGQLDIVVNNAGVVPRNNQSVPEMELEEYREVIGVNIDGTFYVTRTTYPYLTETNGNLIYVGSFDGHYPRPNNPVYAATKWWLRGFAHSVAGSAGDQGIGVTVVNPAKVRTEIGQAGEPSFKDRFEPGEILEPVDVAEAISFAVRQEARATVSELDLFTRNKYSREGF